jgi:hypothetical protein
MEAGMEVNTTEGEAGGDALPQAPSIPLQHLFFFFPIVRNRIEK